VVVAEVTAEDAPEVVLAEDDGVVQAVASDAADDALYERVLPWTPWRDEHFLDARVLGPLPEVGAVHAVPIS